MYKVVGAAVFRVGVHSFAVGDIVEKHYNGKWNYWTTIQDQNDAEAAVAMASSFFRIVRGVRKDVIL